MKLTRFALLAGLAGGAVFAMPSLGHAVPLDYDFALVADSSGPLSSFGVPTSVAADGTVVFRASYDMGGQAILTGSGGALTTIADTAGPYSVLGVSPTISPNGTVAFQADRDAGGSGIYRWSSGTTTTLAQTGSGLNGFGTLPSVNDSGTAAFFVAAVINNQNASGLYSSSGSGLTPIAPLPTYSTNTNALINAGGTAVFWDDFGGSGIFTATGGVPTKVVDTSGIFSDFARNPGLNDAGDIAFIATLDAGGTAVYKTSGGSPTFVANTLGVFSSFLNPDINADGVVAFLANLDAGGQALYTGNGELSRVIGTGDALFGSTVTSLFYLRAFNDAGQLAFFAGLANGRGAIVLASPVDVPEPATLALLAAGLAGLAFLHRRSPRPSVSA